MLMIVFSALITFGWLCCGIANLYQPTISHMSYACAWSILLMYNVGFTILYVIEYLRKRRRNRE